MRKNIKLLIFLVSVLFSLPIFTYAQYSSRITFQAVVRDSNNRLVVNQYVAVRISILQGSPTGPIAFQEAHDVQSNSQGLITLNVGEGIYISGDLSTVSWNKAWIKTEIDVYGNANYNLTDISPIAAVPYALYSERVSDTALGNYLLYNNYINAPQISNLIRDSLVHYTIRVLRPEINDSLRALDIAVNNDTLFFFHDGVISYVIMPLNMDSVKNAIFDSLSNLYLLQVDDSLFLKDGNRTLSGVRYEEQQYIDMIGHDTLALFGGEQVSKVKIPFFRDSVIWVLDEYHFAYNYIRRDSILS
jgi:hypothetical protein